MKTMVGFFRILFRDRWTNRAMMGISLCLILFLFIPRDSIAEHAVALFSTLLMMLFVGRACYIGWCVRSNRRLPREPERVVRRRERVADALFIVWLCLALALIVFRWISRITG